MAYAVLRINDFIINRMDREHDAWWHEELRDHYNLFKEIGTVVMIFGFVLISIAAAVFLYNGNHVLPSGFLFIFFTFVISFLSLVWFLGTYKNLRCFILAYFFIELGNIALFIGSTTTLKDHKILMYIGSTLFTLLFQLGFIRNSRLASLVILKHLLLWYTSRIFAGEISPIFPMTYHAHLLIILMLYISENLKRKNSFEKFSIRKQLEETKKNLKTVLDCFPNGLIVFDVQLNVKYANRKILEYFDCDQTKIVSVLKNEKYINDKRHFQGINLDNLLINDIEKSFDLRNEEESDLGLTSKTEFKYLWKSKKINWEDKEAVLVTCSDITKLIELENIAAESKSKTSLIKSFSHELRTPITAVMYFIEIAYKSKEVPEEIKTNLMNALISSKQLFYQINNFIDLSNILNGKFRLLKETFDLRKWAKEIFKTFQIIAEQKNLKFGITIDEAAPNTIFTDSNRLTQILYSFINNSLKFTEKGSINLKIIPKNASILKFILTDTGIGIPNERLSQLKSFFSTSNQSLLLGVGLYINKLLLHKIGTSKIKVKSKIGNGTKFSFLIDIDESQPSSSDSLYEDPTIDENIKERFIRLFETKKFHNTHYDILVVDDVEINRKIVISILKNKKLKILEAWNGQNAVDIVKDADRVGSKIKVVIMDLNMPIMDGWEATKIIKNLSLNREIKFNPIIIGYSAFSSDDDITKCYECGMSTYLMKPSSPETILKTVEYYLNNKE